MRNKTAKIITISSGKGGVGKTFASVNIAASLVKMGYRVLIFDADINFSNANLFLHVDITNSFSKYKKGEIPFSDLIQKGVGGVDLFYLGDEFKEMRFFSEDESLGFHKELKNLRNQYDYVIFDMPGGINSFVSDWLKCADENILVINSDLPSIIDGYRFIKLNLSEKKNIKFSILINKANSENEAVKNFTSLKATADKFKLRSTLTYKSFIYNDQERVFNSIQKRIPIVLLYPDAPITQTIKQTAKQIVGNKNSNQLVPYTEARGDS